MTEPLALNLTIDGDPFTEALTTATHSAAEVVNRLVGLFEDPPCGFLLVNSDGDFGVTPLAGEQRIVLNPSEGLLRLSATLRAFETDLRACEELLRHSNPSIVSSSDPMVGQGPAAVASGGRPRGGA